MKVAHEERFTDAQLFAMFNVECGSGYLWEISYVRPTNGAISAVQQAQLQEKERKERAAKMAELYAANGGEEVDLLGLLPPPKYAKQSDPEQGVNAGLFFATGKRKTPAIG